MLFAPVRVVKHRSVEGSLMTFANNSRRAIRLLVISFFVFCGLTPIRAQGPPTTSQIKRARNVSRFPEVTWAKVWTENDNPYARIRTDVEKSLASARQPISITDQYRSTAKETVENPENLFRWGYATWILGKRVGNQEARERLYEVRRYLQMASPTPNTYNYVRLRFLIECRLFPGYNALDEIGARLVKKNQLDYDVKRRYVSVLKWSKSSSDRNTALKYAHEMLNSDPNSAEFLAVLGDVYTARWYADKNPDDARSAIPYLQKSIKGARSNSDWPAIAQRSIIMLREALKKSKK